MLAKFNFFVLFISLLNSKSLSLLIYPIQNTRSFFKQGLFI